MKINCNKISASVTIQPRRPLVFLLDTARYFFILNILRRVTTPRFGLAQDIAMKSHKTLQISIKSISETGKEVSLDLGPEWFDQWRQEDPDLEFSRAAIRGTVQLSRHGHDILMRGHLEGELGLACSRCLEPFTAPVETDFDLLLVPAPQGGGPESEELSADELDLDFYQGETVDLEAIIREQIILMMPLKPLCQEDCQGLCPVCGGNLNQESCSCQTEKSNSPFAQLAKLKEK
jgi:uncharacterized protein